VTIIATLAPANVAVEPGAQAAVVVRVRNGGAIVDRFDLAVVGPMAAYARADPPSLSLFPGQEGAARIVFSPPRESSPRAGTFPYGVSVRAAADSSGATVEEGRITVGAFNDASAELVPATSRGSKRGRHEVVVENRGNAPIEVLVGAADPDRLVDFAVTPDRFVVEPGGRGGTTVRAAARDTFFLGSKVSHPFNVEVRPGKATPIALRGTLLQGPMLPSWLVPAGGLALAAIVALIVIPRLTGGGSPGTAAVASTGGTPSPSVVISPSASVAEASASPSDGSGAESEAPTASPTPGPFELTIVGDQITTGGALTTRCPPEPAESDCLRQALDTVRALTTSLGGPFGGRGIVSPDNLAVPNTNTLPIVMSRDQPFPWLAQEGSATDQTDRIVIDLAPLLASPAAFAYAVVDSAAGPRRFVLPDQLARQLLETLYDPTPGMVDPMPDRTIPPFFEVYDPGDLNWQFVIASQAP
jgi:hypothetical protein